MSSNPGDYAHPSTGSAIYPIALLTRTAHLIQRLDGDTVWLPSDIPALVDEVYNRLAQIPSSAQEDAAYDLEQARREVAAGNAAIRPANATGPGISPPAAHGLNDTAIDERIAVRDGGLAVEAVLLTERRGGGYYLHASMEGAADDWFLADDGAVARGDMETISRIVASTIRFPESALTSAVLALTPLQSWRDHPWLGETRALVLNADGEANLDYAPDNGSRRTFVVTYSAVTGLSWSSIRPAT